MKTIKRLLLTTAVVGSLAFLLFGQLTAVNAQTALCAPGSAAFDSTFCQDQRNSEDQVTGPGGIISKIITFISYMVGIVSVFVLIIGGYRFVFSGGNPQAVQGGRNMIIYAMVGLVITVISQAIVVFVLNRIQQDQPAPTSPTTLIEEEVDSAHNLADAKPTKT